MIYWILLMTVTGIKVPHVSPHPFTSEESCREMGKFFIEKYERVEAYDCTPFRAPEKGIDK